MLPVQKLKIAICEGEFYKYMVLGCSPKGTGYHPGSNAGCGNSVVLNYHCLRDTTISHNLRY